MIGFKLGLKNKYNIEKFLKNFVTKIKLKSLISIKTKGGELWLTLKKSTKSIIHKSIITC